MDRTLRAALVAAFTTFAVLAGIGIFLGFEMGASLITGAVAGVLAALLILAAARRADSFHPDGAPPPVEPGFPGPPEHADDRPDRDGEPGHADDRPDRDGEPGSSSEPDDDQR